MNEDDIAIPRNATQLAKRAADAKFDVNIIPTLGTYKGETVQHVAIRIRRDDALIAAFFENGRWRAGVITSPDMARLNAREITALIDSGDIAADLAELLRIRRNKKEKE